MTHIIKIICIALCLGGCKTEPPRIKDGKSYPRMVGDIEHDPKLDSNDFKLCYGDERAYVGYGLEYEGEKPALIKKFEENYKPINIKGETGLLRIRFIVNCKGETGRFRLIGMDQNYQEKTFDNKLTDQILSITKSLKGWKSKKDNGSKFDYYQYLIFKIEDGLIKEILP